MKRQHNDGGLQDDGIFAAWCKVFFLSDSGNVPLLPILKIGNKVLIFVESLS